MNKEQLKTKIVDEKTGKLKTNSFIREHYFQKIFPLEYSKIKKNGSCFSESLYCYLYNFSQIPLCKTCGKELKFLSFAQGYPRFCSNSCSTINKSTQEKKKNTYLEKYGTDNPIVLEQVQKKRRETCINKYGVTDFTKSEKYLMNIDYEQRRENQKKMMKTLKEKYGELEFSRSEEYIRRCFLKKVERISQVFENNLTYDDYISDRFFGKYSVTCKTCKKTFTGEILDTNGDIRCYHCFPKRSRIQEKEILEDLKKIVGSNRFEILTNTKKILNKKELDFYFSEYNLAIEYNGLMFHSIGKSKHSMFNNANLESELKLYHLDKTERCQEKGIQLFHIFENEWLNLHKQDIWKSIIKSKLGLNDRVYARTLVIQPVSYQESCDFLDNNHLQGADKSSIRLGLYNKEGELLSLMTFGKSRYDKKVAWELLRFVSKKGITVVGGASKLFSHFKKNYLQEGESIVSYADRRHSSGNLYEKLGFILSHKSEPNYFYFTESNIFKLESRINYQKHKLKDKLTVFDENLSESENMYNNGYRKIYDCGNFVYIFKKGS